MNGTNIWRRYLARAATENGASLASLLDIDNTVRKVTWSNSVDRVDKYNEKARKRHVELVIARALKWKERERARGLE